MCITFIQCWTNVFDVGPALYKCYTNVLCLLGRVSAVLLAVMSILTAVTVGGEIRYVDGDVATSGARHHSEGQQMALACLLPCVAVCVNTHITSQTG